MSKFLRKFINVKINFLQLKTLFQRILIIYFLMFSQNIFAQPIPITTDSRIKTLVFNPNEVFELKFFYGYQSFIEFADGEEIEMISIGESFAWKITPAGKRLFIRPLEISAHTNMTIISNKRTYHFDIKSGEYDGKADEELVYTVRFYYPQIGQPLPIPPQLAMPTAAKKPPITKRPAPSGKISDPVDAPNILAIGGNPEGFDLNFDYSLSGKADNIVPLKVYDNGQETFFQFTNNNISVPTISIVNAFGAERPLNYVIENDYVVVPAVGRQFTLRLANGLLCVYNNKMLTQ